MPNVLIIDDDPTHLRIYSWIVQHGGFRSFPLLPTGDRIELPESETIDVVLLDYRLGETLNPVEISRRIRSTFPHAAIVVLSDVMYMPHELAPYASVFVRKGQPEHLLETLASLTTNTQAATPSDSGA